MLGDLGDEVLGKGDQVLKYHWAYRLELRVRMKVSAIKLTDKLQQGLVGILSGCTSLIKLHLHAVHCILISLRVFSPTSGNTIMEGYSINLGFQAMRILSFTLKIAADLTWYCTKYAGLVPMAHR